MTHRDFMSYALKLAEKAERAGDVPVGAVVVKGGEIIGRGYNLREKDQNAVAHAEIVAIDAACKKLGSWRLEGCTLYVTLEPCPMCTGAVINSRIDRVVYGCIDFKGGAMGGRTDLCQMGFNHTPQVIGGIMDVECREILDRFFEKLRKNKSGI